MNTQLREGIDWVGYVDWSVRNFHGYRTERGSSYNAYLVQDEKTALIDTVKAPYVRHLIENVSAKTELSKVDYVVCNHAEPDHAGGLPAVMKACPQATLVCNARCRDALTRHFPTADWTFHIVATGDTLSLGKRTLSFVETPMVHWPESMFTYCQEEKLLFSMDAFGQHFATAFRFDDEEWLPVIMTEAKTYFANIVMPFNKPILRAFEAIKGLPVELIAPSHGVIWRKNIPVILQAYQDWVKRALARKVLVIYDTMWKSTEMMARAIHDGALDVNVDARLLHMGATHITELATEILDAAGLAVGSPTLNQGLMPGIAGALTYLRSLKPGGRAAFAFGSYGWAGRGATQVNEYLTSMRMEILRPPLESQFVPDEAVLTECREAGRALAQRAIALCDEASL